MFDQDKLLKEIEKLENKTSDEDLWKDNLRAKKFLQTLKSKKNSYEIFKKLDIDSVEILELCQISIDLDDQSSEKQILESLNDLDKNFNQVSLKLKLNGKYDQRNAIIGIKQGAGGIDSQDWAEILFRMYKRWSDSKNFTFEIIDFSQGEEAGIKSAVVRIEGENAYGMLQSEKGTHRLVRISPFDTGNRRHTSFSLVEIMPELESEEELIIDPKDLRIDVFKAGGAGGQSVQKNSTAVRINHLPSGLNVSVQNERSQLHNKDLAMKILQSRLMELEIIKNKQKELEIKGEHVSPDFGSQIRSYVMHPYKIVKDHRTSIETSDIDSVLDGDIDMFIEGFLIKNIQS
ncbi:MAG: peptide chain release factor 2 [Dehalococcoidia bacterium]|nr:peptide chain release factor 2 [Dehalococcoidia bacterium]